MAKYELLYGKTVGAIMREYFDGLGPNEAFSTKDIKKHFEEKYPEVSKGYIRAHLDVYTTNRTYRRNSVREENNLLYKIDGSNYRMYDKANDPPPIYNVNVEDRDDDLEEIDDATTPEIRVGFATEAHLRDYIAENLHAIEPGLTLYGADKGVSGVEFNADGKRIDILAVDKDNNFVVIELKKLKSHDSVIGQLLRYTAWVKNKMAKDGQKVRGVIVCETITEDLRMTCSELNDVELFEYEMSFKLRKPN